MFAPALFVVLLQRCLIDGLTTCAVKWCRRQACLPYGSPLEHREVPRQIVAHVRIFSVDEGPANSAGEKHPVDILHKVKEIIVPK